MTLIFVLYALIASTFVMAKYALFYAKPIFLIGVRMVLAGTILLGYLKLFDKNNFKIDKTDTKNFLLVALYHIYLSFILEFWALQYLSSSKTNIIYSITPFISAFIAYYFYKEKLNIYKKIGMLLGILAIIPVLVAQYNPQESGSILNFSTAEVAMLAAVFFGAYAWFLIKDLMNKNYSLILINGFAMLVGGIGALATSLIFEVLIPVFSEYNKYGQVSFANINLVSDYYKFFLWIGALILTSNIIVYNLFGFLIKKYSITFLTLAGFLSPVFGAIGGYFLLKEPISWHYLASLALITLALYIFNVQERVSRKL